LLHRFFISACGNYVEFLLGYRQAVRQQVLILPLPGSNPGTPAIQYLPPQKKHPSYFKVLESAGFSVDLRIEVKKRRPPAGNNGEKPQEHR
jgi:hypothetical protein